MTIYSHVVEVVSKIVDHGAIKATRYVSKKQVVRAVLRTYKAKKTNPTKEVDVQIILKIGRPNYVERDFIKKCVEAGEPFPVKKSQLKFPNKKLNKLSRV